MSEEQYLGLMMAILVSSDHSVEDALIIGS